MTKSYYDTKPIILEKIKNGKYYYRWNIKQHSITDENGEHLNWECYEIIVYSPLSSNKILEKAIESLWDKNIEQKMLNDYNAAILNVLDSSYIEKYKNFLNERKSLKEQINLDCKNFGIE